METRAARWVSRRAETALERSGEVEVERLLVAGAVVQRQGDHYWIVKGGETWEDLQRVEQHHRR
jgi:hypothetical protein